MLVVVVNFRHSATFFSVLIFNSVFFFLRLHAFRCVSNVYDIDIVYMCISSSCVFIRQLFIWCSYFFAPHWRGQWNQGECHLNPHSMFVINNNKQTLTNDTITWLTRFSIQSNNNLFVFSKESLGMISSDLTVSKPYIRQSTPKCVTEMIEKLRIRWTSHNPRAHYTLKHSWSWNNECESKMQSQNSALACVFYSNGECFSCNFAKLE